jgi:hypothetical protein
MLKPLSELESRLSELEVLLREELSAYTHLVNRLPFKLALIKKNRTAQLERLLVQEAAEMEALSALEVRREALAKAIAGNLPQPAETFRGMLGQVPAEFRERLEPLGNELRAKVEDLQAGNRTCQELLRLSIEYAAFTLDLIAQAAAPEGMTYDGGVNQAPSLILDRRA